MPFLKKIKMLSYVLFSFFRFERKCLMNVVIINKDYNLKTAWMIRILHKYIIGCLVQKPYLITFFPLVRALHTVGIEPLINHDIWS